jgi:hypothetical protein
MFEYLTFALAVASMVLHFIKGKTSNKVVAEASNLVDEAQNVAPIVAPILGASAPTNPNAPKASIGFGTMTTAIVRDHRK